MKNTSTPGNTSNSLLFTKSYTKYTVPNLNVSKLNKLETMQQNTNLYKSRKKSLKRF